MRHISTPGKTWILELFSELGIITSFHVLGHKVNRTNGIQIAIVYPPISTSFIMRGHFQVSISCLISEAVFIIIIVWVSNKQYFRTFTSPIQRMATPLGIYSLEFVGFLRKWTIAGLIANTVNDYRNWKINLICFFFFFRSGSIRLEGPILNTCTSGM